MSPIGMGYKSKGARAREASWATPPTVTKATPFLSQGIEQVVLDKADEQYSGSMGVRDYRKINEHAAGQLTMHADYENQLDLIDAVMGTATYGANGGATVGGSPNTHTWTMKELLNSHTYEFNEGDIPAGKVALIVGAKMAGWTLKGTAEGEGAMLQHSFDVIGKSKTYNVSPSASPALATRYPILMSDISVFDDGSGDATQKVREFELAVRTGAEPTRRNGGSLYIDEPLRDKRPTVSIRVVMERWTHTKSGLYQSKTPVSVSVRFGGAARYLDIYMANAYVQDCKPDRDRWGMLTEEITYVAAEDATYSMLKVIVANGEAAIY